MKATSTQKVQIGDQVFDAAAVILMKDRDRTLEEMSQNKQVRAATCMIPFQAPESRATLADALNRGYQLLAIILADGSTKYQISNADHLPLAEEIGSQVDDEALRRLPQPGTSSPV